VTENALQSADLTISGCGLLMISSSYLLTSNSNQFILCSRLHGPCKTGQILYT